MAARQNYYVESTGTDTTTSTTYVDKTDAVLTFTPDASSTYVLIWSCMASSADTAEECRVRLFHDTASAELGQQEFETQEATTPPDFITLGGIATYTSGASPTSQTFSIEFATSLGTTQVSTKEAHLVAIKLHADDEIGSSTGTSTTTSATPTAKATATFTPGSSGDYLIFASGELISPTASTAGWICQLDVDSTNYSIQTLVAENATSYLPFFTILKQTLSAASHTVQTEFASRDGTSTITIRNSHVYCLRLDTLNGSFYDESRTRDTTTSSTYQTKLTGTHTPVAAEYLQFFSHIADAETNTNSLQSQHRKGTTVWMQGDSEGNVNASQANEHSFFTFRRETLTASSTTWDVRYNSENNSSTVGIHSAVIALLQTGDVSGSDLSSAGSGATSFVGESEAGGDLSSAASASTSLVGESTAGADISSDGAASTSLVGESTAGADVSSDGAAATSLVGVAVSESDISSAGIAVASFESVSVFESILSASASASAAFDSLVAAPSVTASSGGPDSEDAEIDVREFKYHKAKLEAYEGKTTATTKRETITVKNKERQPIEVNPQYDYSYLKDIESLKQRFDDLDLNLIEALRKDEELRQEQERKDKIKKAMTLLIVKLAE